MSSSSSLSTRSKKKRGHVAFTVEAEEKPRSTVTVREESLGAGVVDPLGRRQCSENNEDSTTLRVHLGMLKCGFRYESIVPVGLLHDGSTIRSVQMSSLIDPNDLVAEPCCGTGIHETAHVESPTRTDINSTRVGSHTSDTNHHGNNNGDYRYLRIRLAARRPGPYQRRFAMELVQMVQSGQQPHHSHGDITVVWVQMEAMMMGKDQGTPQLKEHIQCLGKLVGYDSDDETEWQGFDHND